MKNIPNDYKAALDKFVADIYAKFDDEDKKREEFNEIKSRYYEIQKQLQLLIDNSTAPKAINGLHFIDNAQFLKLMNVSPKTAQTWRDNGIISYSQIGSKIYYQQSDIEQLLKRNHFNSKKP